MGLFSSEEDVTSIVADEFRAGGYLAAFFVDAVSNGRADLDDDGDLTAIEVSQYLHDRYRADVKQRNYSDDIVDAAEINTSYQHLVVDRGGISPHAVLFTHGRRWTRD